MNRTFLLSMFLGISILPLFSCNHPLETEDTGFVFGVFNVGQGLSQIGVRKTSAVIWDMGPEDISGAWKNAYRSAGSPMLVSIIISHRDLDHSGGLRFLDSTVNWNGELISSKYEDTSYIRSLCTDVG